MVQQRAPSQERIYIGRRFRNDTERLEKLFHKLFEPARLEITIDDRFGNPVQPQEWFLVPLFVIDEAVDRIKDGSITRYVYDPKSAALVLESES